MNLNSTVKGNFSGVAISFAIGLISWFLGKMFTVVGGAVFAILIGIAVSSSIGLPDICKLGTKFTSKKLLQFSIILLGFQMNFFAMLKVGGQALLITLCTISVSFVTAYFVSRALNIKWKTATLIGIGTAICGGSAIAATAPIIKASDEEISYSISTIFLFNLAAVFIFPPLGRTLGLSDYGFGLWAGTAINDTSSVVAAAQVWGDESLTIATIVKLSRTLMIIPISFILSVATAKKGLHGNRNNTNFKFYAIFPWFILLFVLAAIVSTSNILPTVVAHFLSSVGKFFIVVAMAAIGLNTNITQLTKNGFKPVLLGLSSWVATAAVSLFIQNIIHIW